MLNAIYYPHTAIRDENFLKHALLYWDEIEYISPFADYDALPRYPDATTRELARFLKPRVPTNEEKERAHIQIMQLVGDGLPQWLEVGCQRSEEETDLYTMFSEKLLPETWSELRERRLVRPEIHGDLDDYSIHSYLGLTMMAILARCCAGSLKHTITDRVDFYVTLLKHLQFLTGEGDAETGGDEPQSQGILSRWTQTLGGERPRLEDEERKALIAVTLEVINASSLSLEALVELRSSKQALATQLRQNYAKAIQIYVDQLTAPGLESNDAETLRSEFRRSMEFDMARLYEELRPLGKKALLSKEVAVAIIASVVGGGSALASIGLAAPVGGILGALALGKLSVEYSSARAAVFEKHPMAFLYSSENARLY
jgi:hypothetical protein